MQDISCTHLYALRHLLPYRLARHVSKRDSHSCAECSLNDVYKDFFSTRERFTSVLYTGCHKTIPKPRPMTEAEISEKSALVLREISKE